MNGNHPQDCRNVDELGLIPRQIIRVNVDDFPDPLREVPNHLLERTTLLTDKNLEDMLLVTQIIIGLVIRSEEPIGPIRILA